MTASDRPIDLILASDKPIELSIRAARHHGDFAEPDAEVGDLQILLRAAWRLMPEKARLDFMIDPEVVETLANAGDASAPDPDALWKELTDRWGNVV